MASSVALFFFFFFFFLLLPCSLLAQNRSKVTVGNYLTAGEEAEAWVSPSGDFAMGFRQLENKDLYMLAIWYNNIPDKTIVWFAKGDDPAPRRSRADLTADRGLVLTGPQGTEIWKSGVSVGEAAYGSMNDTGNFIISNTEAEILWQSFEDPRDTMLPTQTLEKNGRSLGSRLRETNFSRGRFQFRLIGDGNGVLNVINLPTAAAYDAYYWTRTNDANASNAGLRVVFNESGYLYVLRASNTRELITPAGVVPGPATDYYHRVTLHFDGVLVQYSHPKNSSGDPKWSIINTTPENICYLITEKGTGPCGFNGICQLSADQRAICSCPQRFSPIDPDDEYGGCKPDFYSQFCEQDVSTLTPQDFEFIELTNTDWPTSDYEIYQPYTIEECQKACRQDCLCNVIVFKGGSCWKKKLPLSNGRQDEKVNGKALIKVSKGNYTAKGLPPLPFPYPKKNQDTLVLVVCVLLGGSVFANLASFCFFFFYNNKRSSRNYIPQAAKSNLRYFSCKELMEATNGFKEELGRGSFGIVYKGLMKLGNNVPIAVKKLDRLVADSEKEFKTEVEVIGQTHHKNLVKLVGFCDEGQHRLLVYEFVSNGTLSNFLFGDIKLSWEQRTQIAYGIARGLVYLHEECSTQILHCDIKPQNILLDECYDAKIADFGLAKLLLLDQSQTFTAIRGTKGYVAPEWFRNIPVTVKVDVYSFGVLLLEMICCRRNVDTEISEEEAILSDWAYDCYAEGKVAALVENDEEALNDMAKVKRFVMVAIWCIQEDPNLRPTMKMVTLMLEGTIKVAVPPCPCPFSVVS